jgi:predicted dehydrogenase
VRASCRFGKWHPIEVEDEVTAHLLWPDGVSGTFICSTGEAPGTDRLEIACERGRVVMEDGRIDWIRNAVPTGEFCRTTPERFARPETWKVEVPVPAGGGEHTRIVANVVDAILDGAALLTPVEEGLRSLELGNAMILSSLTDRTVALPLDGADYERRLNELIASSTARRAAGAAAR